MKDIDEIEAARMAVCLCAELLVSTAKAVRPSSEEAYAALMGAADAMGEDQANLADKAVSALSDLRTMVNAKSTGGSA